MGWALGLPVGGVGFTAWLVTAARGLGQTYREATAARYLSAFASNFINSALSSSVKGSPLLADALHLFSIAVFFRPVQSGVCGCLFSTYLTSLEINRAFALRCFFSACLFWCICAFSHWAHFSYCWLSSFMWRIKDQES